MGSEDRALEALLRATVLPCVCVGAPHGLLLPGTCKPHTALLGLVHACQHTAGMGRGGLATSCFLGGKDSGLAGCFMALTTGRTWGPFPVVLLTPPTPDIMFLCHIAPNLGLWPAPLLLPTCPRCWAEGARTVGEPLLG